MAKKDWMRMVKSGECLTVEFKRQVPKLERLARTFSAFSNSSGGTVFFGVNDDCEVVGLESVNGTRELVEQVSQFHCNPAIRLKMTVWPVLGMEVLVVEVPEAHEKPVYAVAPNNPKDTWPFFRSGKENLPLDKKSIKSMRRTENSEVDEAEIARLDRHAIHMLNALNKRPRQTLNMLAKSANISPHRAKKIIVQLERNGWIHGFFNEKRREFSLVIPWKNR
ncbi:MAG: putative DNA binding domain-containing protein [Acidobacteriota bacterium]|nr:putative DNA binding domain-containing protein [Acidobacteriota bacterium]